MRPIFVIFLVWLALPAGLPAQSAAQPPLPTVVLAVNDRKITAEIADEPSERATGLMFREKLAPDAGMLFIMPETGPAAFWMKNTLIPLSIAYISEAGMILEIHDLKPHDETTVRSGFDTIAYALEMEQGWFAKNRILPGDVIRNLPRATHR